MQRVVSPSDITNAGFADGSPVVVGGRVVVTAPGEVFLTDAFGSIAVALRADASIPESGDLVSVSGEVANGRIENAAIITARSTGTSELSDVARFRDAGLGASLVNRARVLSAIRDHFAAEAFVEVETPCVVPSPGLDRHLDAFQIEDASPSRFLITSPEYQMKRLVTGGVPRCFQIARCFRRAEVGGHHNPELSTLEWYRAFAGMDEILSDTESVVRAAVRAVTPSGALTIGDLAIDIESPFRRMTIASAFHDLARVEEKEMLALANDDEEQFFRILVDRIEPALARLPTPVVLHRYPAKMASLAALSHDDKRYADRFEVYVGGLELSNGFVELTSASEQRERLLRDQHERRAAGQPVYPIDERFVAALEEGLPDCAGNALGLDRLIMIASGRKRIADVLAFPEGVL